MYELAVLEYVTTAVRARLDLRHRDEQGMTTETVIITALLASLALVVGAIIVAKVTGKAQSIPTE